MRKSLGNKRKYFTDEQIQQITALYTGFEEGKDSKIFDNADFGYTKVTVERPHRNAKGQMVMDKHGRTQAGCHLRDYEKIPLKA